MIAAIIDYLCEAQPKTSGPVSSSPGATERGPGSAEHGAPSGETWREIALRVDRERDAAELLFRADLARVTGERDQLHRERDAALARCAEAESLTEREQDHRRLLADDLNALIDNKPIKLHLASVVRRKFQEELAALKARNAELEADLEMREKLANPNYQIGDE